MTEKEVVSIELDESLLKEAHDLGLNLSDIVDHALARAIEDAGGIKEDPA